MYTNEIIIVEKNCLWSDYGCVPLMALHSATRPGSPDRACSCKVIIGLAHFFNTYFPTCCNLCASFFVKTNFKIFVWVFLLAKDIVFRFIIRYI